MLSHSRAALALGMLLLATACGDSLPPTVGDPDGSFPDLGLFRDGQVDATVRPDSGTPADTGVPPDTGLDPNDSGLDPNDSGLGPDSGTNDAQVADSGDSGVDVGVIIPDEDGDGISDDDEGNGLVDTDGDGTPDTQDTDSDNDGIPDAIEAGDTDPATPPVDTDLDGTPDFRDDDSDGDNISDLHEGAGDPDLDRLPNFRDPDSDGDGIPDEVEAGDADLLTPPVDTNLDGTPDFLDTDSDGDGISDLIEGTLDPDLDLTPNYLDDDSDGDTIPDELEGSSDRDNDQTPNFLDLDADGDGIPDEIEGTGDPDTDGTPNFLDFDADGDTISDFHEGLDDPDNDNIPNYLDTDSDGDTLFDSEEAGDTNLNTPPVHTDNDGVPDYLDLDSDNDRILDRHELRADTDGDGLPDRRDIDSDGDSIFDIDEAGDANANTPPVDTDLDGTPDYQDLDSDADTIYDLNEGNIDTDLDGTPDFRDTDSDSDGWLDIIEAGDANPLTPPVDTDDDGRPDYVDVDSDADGLADRLEPGCPVGPSRLLQDSDNDGFVDPAEVAYGSNPCSGASGIDDFYFILPAGGPGDNAPLVFSDTGIDRTDVAINIDTTGSMGGELANIQTSLSTLIIPGVGAVIPDAAFAVSSFEDFPLPNFGEAAAGDLPFVLSTRVTTNAATAQAAVNALTIGNGLDLPESGLESLYQIATGAGVIWPTGAVPPFDPAQNLVPNVADGSIGGVGFRDDALPVIVHITDAFSHERSNYQRVNAGIEAAETAETQAALSAIGARVVTIANSRLPNDPGTAVCTGASPRILGNIAWPVGSDVDWFVLTGVPAGATVIAETTAYRVGANVDSMIAIYNNAAQLAINDDIAPQNYDSRVQVVTSGAGPYYVAVTTFNDPDFDATGSQYPGMYFLDVTVNGTPYTTSIAQCRADDGNNRATATSLVPFGSATPPANTNTCLAGCDQVLEPLTLPFGMSTRTGALVPPCAWDEFGPGRPAGCAADECCTGLNGAGRAANLNNLCPLTFDIDDNGDGLGPTMVSALEALVGFSTFTITTVVRGDPAAAFDTACFIRSIIPVAATPPNTCAPQPTAVDLFAPSPELDSWANVVPGTVLEFDVSAINVNEANGQPCAPAAADPQLFRAYIDVVADGVTVVDTRDVIIIVPPLPPVVEN